MSAWRIIQISDTHLWSRGGPMAANFSALAELVNARPHPDLVVHTGDIGALSPESDADRRAAADMLGQIEAPLVVLPGNHDVGGLPGGAWMGVEVTARHLAAYRATFGPDRWLRILDDEWALVGINSQVLGSGLPDDEVQLEWLRATGPEIGRRQVVLFIHRPLWWPSDEHPPGHPELGVTDQSRLVVLDALSGCRLAAVASGHLHRFRCGYRGDVLEVWAPATGLLARGPHLPPGQEDLGLVELTLEAGRVDARFVTVPGLVELEPRQIPVVNAVIEELAGREAETAG
jgi:3',5'-cyclic AMP phosphodiesterase CpdA